MVPLFLALLAFLPGTCASATRGVAVPDIAIQSGTDGRVAATAWVRNSLDNTTNVRVRFRIVSGDKVLAEAQESATIPPLLTQGVEVRMRIPPGEVRLWGLDTPHLYRMDALLSKDAEAVEGAYETTTSSLFGLRSIEARGRQLLLNSEEIRLAGADLSLHPPSPNDLTRLKESGRLLNLAPSATEAVLDWADRNGVLLISGEPKQHGSKHQGHHPSVVTADVVLMKRGESPCNHQKPVIQRGGALPQQAECLSGWLVPQENPQPFSSLVIRNVRQANGNTMVEIENRAGFPHRVIRNHEIQVGHQVKKIPDLKPGEGLNLEFEDVNPYRIDVRDSVGTVVLNR